MNILNTAYASSYFKLETTKGNTITGRTMEAPGLIYGKMAIVPRGYAFEIIGKKSEVIGDANEIRDISNDELDSSTDGGLGLVARHDSRDNMFSPNSGHYGELAVSRYDDVFGGDFDYTYLKASSLSWWGLLPKVVLGMRRDGRFTWGDTPFWSVPFISMRGIPSLRYQGDSVFVAEIEPRWDVTNRWSLVGFVGSGWAEDSISDFDGSSAEISGGIGFRYLAARRMGMRVGLDIARGPDDTVVYLQVGSGWH